MLYRPISTCRICGHRALEPVLDLGTLALTGTFPRPTEEVPTGPLSLVRCADERGCGLVQLAHDYETAELYGDNYGYRSGLNSGMARHLQHTARELQALRPLERGDVVLDIGSNDGTTLAGFDRGPTLVGIDPTADKFRAHYRDDVLAHAALFSADAYRSVVGARKAKIITSMSMFYDLPEPQRFVNDVAAVLADDGVWRLEQSYLPTMLARNAYDTVCHEHLEYYGLKQVAWMFERAGLHVIDVAFNDINGGSFAVTAAKARAGEAQSAQLARLLADEGPSTDAAVWARFNTFVRRHREELPAELDQLARAGARIAGLGASTKGNVTLQVCGIGPALLPRIGEINAEKFGHLTPGTKIPIAPEAEVLSSSPDVLLVLPWHFRAHFTKQHAGFLARGGRLLFPLPHIESERA